MILNLWASLLGSLSIYSYLQENPITDKEVQDCIPFLQGEAKDWYVDTYWITAKTYFQLQYIY